MKDTLAVIGVIAIIAIAVFLSPWGRHQGQTCVNVANPNDPLGIMK